jgi:hypothetical protein
VNVSGLDRQHGPVGVEQDAVDDHSYSKRAGGPAQFAHAREIAPDLIGEDPNDIARLWTELV